MSEVIRVGATFPSKEHRERIKRYRDNKKLIQGKHDEVFLSRRSYLSKQQRDLLYISTNLPALICKKSADFLFGEPASFDAGVKENSKEQDRLDTLNSENDMNILTYESALGCAFKGDSFFKIRWGQRWQGHVNSKLDPFRVFIEPQNAEYVIPETLPGDSKNIFAYHIFIPIPVPNMKGKEYTIKFESHYPGSIIEREFRGRPSLYEGNVPVEFNIYAEIEDSYKEIPTEVPFPLVVHIPNFALEDSWEGLDDLSEHYSLFDEINMRLSLIAEILDKHSDPAMMVPPGSLDEDENGNPVFHAGRDKIFEYEKGDPEAQYITWNGQLESAFKELDKLVDFLLMTAEIPAVVLGKDNSGTSGSSGSGIKQRMNSLLLKIKRKRQYFEKGLRRVLVIAQMVEHAKSDKVDYEIVMEPRILFNERLADDEMERAQVAQIRSGGKPTKSQKSILVEDYKLTEEQADREIARIREEEKLDGFVNPSIFQKDIKVDDLGDSGEQNES